MKTSFNLQLNKNRSQDITRVWIPITAGKNTRTDGEYNNKAYPLIGKYRTCTEGSDYYPEDVLHFYHKQPIEEVLFLSLAHAVHFIASGYSPRPTYSKITEPFLISLNILSSNNTFLESLKFLLTDTKSKTFCSLSGYDIENTINLLRLCVKVTGILLAKDELGNVGRSDNPVEAIEMLW